MRPLGDDVDLARIGRYRGLAELDEAVVASGGEVVEAGRSCEGRAIHRIDVGPRDAPRVTLVIAGLHAMEWIGVETALALVRAWSPSPTLRLVVLPLLNPDGYARVERALREGRWRFTRANAAGVDLNRNFPTHFRARHLVSTLFPILGRPGPAPGSEPETRATLEVLARERGKIDRAVSLHSFGKKLLLPFGGRWQRPTDHVALASLAREVNRGLGDRYEIRTASRWGPGAFAYGMELDHFHAEGIAPLLVECTAGGLSLRDPTSWAHPFRWFNPRDPERQSVDVARALAPFVEG